MAAAFRFAGRTEGLSGSAIREIFKHSAKPGMISFAGGNPAAFALPNEQIAGIAQDLLMQEGKVLLQYGQTEGYPPLKQALIPYLQEHFQLDVALEELLITCGSMQGLDLLLKALVNPGDVVLTESPAFLGALQAMKAFQARIVPVPSDEDGMNVDALEGLIQQHRPKLIYCIPTFQNPTGRSLSLARRQRLAQLAAQYEVPVAEDDPYRQLRYRGQPLPPVKAFDKAGWVVLMGSFSKIISPGLRVGFLAGASALIRKCTIFKQCSDVHTPNLNQAIVQQYLVQGLLPPHIDRICAGYSQLLDAMLSGLKEVPRLQAYTQPEGGLFIFAQAEPDVDAGKLMALCIERGMVFVPGEPFYPEGGHRNSLRLNFSNADQPAISRGIAILADSLRDYKN